LPFPFRYSLAAKYQKQHKHTEFGGIPDIGARKTVIRSLDIAMEQEHIDQRVLNDYAKLFSNLLSMSHVQALAALFGWNVPEGLRNMSNVI